MDEAPEVTKIVGVTNSSNDSPLLLFLFVYSSRYVDNAYQSVLFCSFNLSNTLLNSLETYMTLKAPAFNNQSNFDHKEQRDVTVSDFKT